MHYLNLSPTDNVVCSLVDIQHVSITSCDKLTSPQGGRSDLAAYKYQTLCVSYDHNSSLHSADNFTDARAYAIISTPKSDLSNRRRLHRHNTKTCSAPQTRDLSPEAIRIKVIHCVFTNSRTPVL